MEFDEYAVRERDRLVRTASLLGCPAGRAESLAHTALRELRRSWPHVRSSDDPGAGARRSMLETWRRRFADAPPEDLPAPLGHDPGTAAGLAVRRALAALPPSTRLLLVDRFHGRAGMSSAERPWPGREAAGVDPADAALVRLAADPEVVATLPAPVPPDERWGRTALAAGAATIDVAPPPEQALRLLAEAPRRPWVALGMVAGCLAALVGVAGWTIGSEVVPPPPGPVTASELPALRMVPGIEAATRDEARAFLAQVGLRPQYEFRRTCRHAGRVLTQRPAEGVRLPADVPVLVVVGIPDWNCGD